MPSAEALIAFAVASIILIVVPGPSVLFVIGRSLAHGRRGGIMSVLGNSLGTFVLVVAVALGVGSIVAQSILAFTIVKLLGAGYLVYLGIQAIRHRRIGGPLSGEDGPGELSTRTMLGQGFLVGITNPKTIVFFIAVLPQFTDFHAGSVPVQMLVLGTVAVLIGVLFDSIWALGAGAARDWLGSSPRRMSTMRASGGGMMIALGGTLALTGAKS